jgi:transketolase
MTTSCAIRPAQPDWPERDRMILSKGHGCIALYVMLADKGFFPLETLDTFCRRDSILGGHPEASKVPGVEASTGALGHGLSYGVGMALAARIRRRDSRVIVVMGDGEINEGSVWEAALCAGKHGLSNLTAVIDYNKLQSAGPTREIQDLEPLADKWRAFNFAVAEVDGHDVAALRAVFARLPLAKIGRARSSATP